MSYGLRSIDAVDDDCLSTGVQLLDTEIINGLPKGSVVSIVSDPMGSGEMFLQHLAATGRQTYYISLLRSDTENLFSEIQETKSDEISKDLENIIEFKCITIDTDITQQISTYLSELQPPENCNIIIDGLTILNSPTDMLSILEQIRKLTVEHNGISYVHIPRIEQDLKHNMQDIFQSSDAIFNIRINRVGSDRLDNLLYISKIRRKNVQTEPIKLDISNQITINTTDDIG